MWLTEGIQELSDRLAKVWQVVNWMRCWSWTLPLLRHRCWLTCACLRSCRLTAARCLCLGLASFSLARRHAEAQAVDELHERTEVKHVGDPCGARTLPGPLGPAEGALTISIAHTRVVHSMFEELVWSAKELTEELGVLKNIYWYLLFSIVDFQEVCDYYSKICTKKQRLAFFQKSLFI